jgi:PAS domain S-box-containing protein
MAFLKKTKKRDTDLDLMKSEEKYRLLVENVNDAIVISQNDKFIFFNNQFAEMLGYSIKELYLKDYREVYSEKSVNILKEREIKRNLGEDVPSRYETVFIRKDGSEIDLEANVSIIEYRGQKATFAVIRDITERKLAEKELAEKEQKYRMLFNLSPSGIILEDLDGKILDVNAAFCKTMGYKREEIVGKKVHMFTHPDERKNVDNNISLLSRGRVLKHKEKSIRKDGSLCFMRMHETKIVLSNGKEGILCISEDISDQVSAEEEKIQKEKMQGILEMAGAVCHELNQPMTVISVNSDLLLMNLDEKDDKYKKISAIKEQIIRMGKITTNLTRITKYETRDYINGTKIVDIAKSSDN